MPRRLNIFLTILLLFLGAFVLATPQLVEAGACRASRGVTDVCHLPPPMPTFSEPELPAQSFLDDVGYGWINDYAYFYAEPKRGADHVRTALTGFFYGPVEAEATDDEGRQWYKVWNYWLPARSFHPVEHSQFIGVRVNNQPEHAFGWVTRPFAPRTEPGPQAGQEMPLVERYDFVEVMDSTVGSDGAMWVRIADAEDGRQRWLRYHTLSLVRVRQRPEPVGENEYWVDVDLTQQIFAAYEGDRMVYAGLIASGLPRWPTRVGLGQVWARFEKTKMSGGVVGDDYYYLEDVPHTMYYDGEIALHGAYWHDDFGRQKSHGCVNMAPRDAEWVFNWSEDAPNDLWVWSHHSRHGEFLK